MKLLLPPSEGSKDQLQASLVVAAEGRCLHPASPTLTYKTQVVFHIGQPGARTHAASASGSRAGFRFSAQAVIKSRSKERVD